MRLRIAILAAVAGVLLAVGAAVALAQSAGDQQYTDPLAGQTPPSGGHKTSGGGSGSGSPSTGSPSSSVAPSSSSGPSSGSPTAASPSSTTGTATGAVPLARTGFDAWIPALAGVMLIGISLLLRRSIRAERS